MLKSLLLRKATGKIQKCPLPVLGTVGSSGLAPVEAIYAPFLLGRDSGHRARAAPEANTAIRRPFS